MAHFFKWDDLKASEEHLAHMPHVKFRLVTTVFLILALSLLLIRVSYLSSSSIVLSLSFAAVIVLFVSAIHLIFTTRLLLSKLVLFASVLLFQAVEFGQSPLLNLSPLTPGLAVIVAANLLFLFFLSAIKD